MVEAEVEKGIKVPVYSYKEQYTKDSSTAFQKAGDSHRIRLSETFAQVDFNFGVQFGASYHLFEVCKDQKSGYCRIL